MRQSRRASRCHFDGGFPDFFDDYLGDLRRMIAIHGHAVQSVGPGSGDPGWAYTIGLHEAGLPELIVIGGMSVRDQGGVLNEFAARMREAGPPEPGKPVPGLLEDYDVKFIEVVNTSGEWFAVANRMQSSFRALQLVWPDHDNRFPWEAGCEIPLGLQPLLGPPPP